MLRLFGSSDETRKEQALKTIESYESGKVYSAERRKDKQLDHDLWTDKLWTGVYLIVFLTAFFGGGFLSLTSKNEKLKTAGLAAVSTCIGAVIQRKTSEKNKTSVD
jgi:hypothetical protein